MDVLRSSSGHCPWVAAGRRGSQRDSLLARMTCVLMHWLSAVAALSPRAVQWIDELACLVCGAGDNDEQLMLCEGAGNLNANCWKCSVARLQTNAVACYQPASHSVHGRAQSGRQPKRRCWCHWTPG